MYTKIFTILLLQFLSLNCIYSQDLDALEFLAKYNEHIDPLKKLDVIKYMSRDSKLSAKTNLSSTGEYTSENAYYYSIDGGVFEAGFDKHTGQSKISDIIGPNPMYYNKYLIKGELEYYRIDSVANRFKLLQQNDSITVIYEQRDEDTYHTITFQTSTFRLLQTKRTTVNKDEIDESTTNFIEFEKVNDIVVPVKIKYSGKYAEATLTYTNYSFKPFDKSVFNSK